MTEQFRQRRFPTNYPIKVHARSGVQQVTVVDVNQNGARIVGLNGVGRGDQVTVEVLSFRFRAIVRWCRADRAGLSFPVPLPPRTVDTIRQSASSTGRMRHTSNGLREMR